MIESLSIAVHAFVSHVSGHQKYRQIVHDTIVQTCPVVKIFKLVLTLCIVMSQMHLTYGQIMATLEVIPYQSWNTCDEQFLFTEVVLILG